LLSRRTPLVHVRTLTTPRLAALSWVVFAVAFAVIVGLLHRSIPEDPYSDPAWGEGAPTGLTLLLTLMRASPDIVALGRAVMLQVVALLLLIVTSLSVWTALVLAMWVLLLSVLVLVAARRQAAGRRTAWFGRGPRAPPATATTDPFVRGRTSRPGPALSGAAAASP
jgi:small-conductance mechanosensitive channel